MEETREPWLSAEEGRAAAHRWPKRDAAAPPPATDGYRDSFWGNRGWNRSKDRAVGAGMRNGAQKNHGIRCSINQQLAPASWHTGALRGNNCCKMRCRRRGEPVLARRCARDARRTKRDARRASSVVPTLSSSLHSFETSLPAMPASSAARCFCAIGARDRRPLFYLQRSGVRGRPGRPSSS